MRFRTYEEATAFVKFLLDQKTEGVRAPMKATVKLDTLPAWNGADAICDGSEIDAVYISYRPATDKQKQQAMPAKMAGVKLERITGRLVDVRKCKDGTVQVLFTNGLRDTDGKIPYRGPNIDKGILCALSINEGLGETVEEIIKRVPEDLLKKLREYKEKFRVPKAKVAEPRMEVGTVGVELNIPKPELELAPVKAKRGPTIIDVPSIEPGTEENRLKLK